MTNKMAELEHRITTIKQMLEHEKKLAKELERLKTIAKEYALFLDVIQMQIKYAPQRSHTNETRPV